MKIFKLYITLIVIIGISFIFISCAQKPLIIEYSGVFRLPAFATSVSIAPFIAEIEGEIESRLKGFRIISEEGKALRLFYATSIVDLGYDDLELDTNLSTELMDATSMNFSFSFTAPQIPGFPDVDISVPDTEFGNYSENVNIDSVDGGSFGLANLNLALPIANPVTHAISLPLTPGENFADGFEGEVLSGTLEASVTLSEDSTLTIAIFNSRDDLIAKIIRHFTAGVPAVAATTLDNSILTKYSTVSISSSDIVNTAKIDLGIKNLKLVKATEVWFDSHTGEGSILIDTGLEAFNFESLALNGNIEVGVAINAFSNASFDATITLYEKGSRALPKIVNLSQSITSSQINFNGDTIKATDLILEYEYKVNSGGSGSYADVDLSNDDDMVFDATPVVYPVSITNFIPDIALNADLPASVVAAVINSGRIDVQLGNGVILDNIEGKLEMKESNTVDLDNTLSLSGETIFGGNATFTVDKISLSGMTQGLDLITVSSSITDLLISSATLTLNQSGGISYSDDISADIPEEIRGLLKRVILNDSPSIIIEWDNNTPVDINLRLLSEEIGIYEMINMMGTGINSASAIGEFDGSDGDAAARATGNTTISLPSVIDVEGKNSVGISVNASPTGYSPDILYVGNEIELGREYTFDSTVSISDIKFDRVVIATDTTLNVLELPVSELPDWFVDNSPYINMKPGSIYASLMAQADFTEVPDMTATILIEDGTGPAANLEYAVPVALNENIDFSGAVEEFLNKPEDFRHVSLAINVKEATVSLNETLNASATVDISVEFNTATDISVATGTQNLSLKEAKEAITYVGGATLTVNLNNGSGVGMKLKLTEETSEGTPVHIVDDTGIVNIGVGISKIEIPIDKKMIDRIVNDGVNFFYEIILAKTPDDGYYAVMGNSNVKVDVGIEINLRYVGKINLSEKK